VAVVGIAVGAHALDGYAATHGFDGRLLLVERRRGSGGAIRCAGSGFRVSGLGCRV